MRTRLPLSAAWLWSLTCAVVGLPDSPSSRASSAFPPLDLPATARFAFLNIGSNKDPVTPPANATDTVAIAFEPLVHHLIPPAPRLFVVPAAVSDESGLTAMRLYDKNGGQSSSLAAGNEGLGGYVDMSNFERRIVPVVTMQSVLSSIPSSIELWFLKTDMQGYVRARTNQHAQ